MYLSSSLFLFLLDCYFFFSSRRRHTRCSRDWSSDVCSSDLRTGSLSWSAARSRSCNPGRPRGARPGPAPAHTGWRRSEEHTSELQSRLHLVCRLLLEKKKEKRIDKKQTDPRLSVRRPPVQQP